jgi:two-component system, LytTR family, response regulator
MKMRCIIVEDEPTARKGLAEDILEIGFIEIIGIAENSSQAKEMLSIQHVDLVFLDIEMPKPNGLDLVKSLKNPPMIIITTAYPEFALEGYDLAVIDYLLKPIAFNRLLKACHKAREFNQFRQNTSIEDRNERQYCFIKSNHNYQKILLTDLLFVEAADNYIYLHTSEKSFLAYQTLKSMEEYLPERKFLRVHKSYIVSIDQINHIQGNVLIIHNRIIPISRNFKQEFLKKITNKKTQRK